MQNKIIEEGDERKRRIMAYGCKSFTSLKKSNKWTENSR
jgi:hypothetical protein